MRSLLAALAGLVALVGATGLSADAVDDALARGLAAIRSMTGCYLVDYNYVEVESLKPGYTRNPRVYDVNRDKSAKEWITADVVSPSRLRLQRVLFLTDLAGSLYCAKLDGTEKKPLLVAQGNLTGIAYAEIS